MASLAELAAAHTTLSPKAVVHLQRLLGSWSLPADLSFADLLLYAPTDTNASQFVVLGHVRSTTGGTVHGGDPIGTVVSVGVRRMLARSFADGVRTEVPITVAGRSGFADPTVEEGFAAPVGARQILVDHVPVRHDGETIAVLTREGEAGLAGNRSGLEREYRTLWRRFATMVEEGTFPLEQQERAGEFREPRVGDGVLVLDRERRVEFASPNAVSALHRLGVWADPGGRTLDEVGVDDAVVRRALETRHSTIAELEHSDDLSVVIRCHPLIEDGRATGVLAVLRDVSEIRSRDRLLVSKDATIREIHHRVKNNLQTIQSLLHLQARRLTSDEARLAVAHSARRIGAIAVVHETLATDATDEVDFDTVVHRVVRLVSEGLSSPDRPLRVDVTGDVGELPGEVAMPLAVAVAELVQNAIDHAGEQATDVSVELDADRRSVAIRVRNGGVGIPDGFSLDRDAGLGLTIVRTFVVSDLGGTLTIRPASTGAPRGAIVEIRVPRRGDGLNVG